MFIALMLLQILLKPYLPQSLLQELHWLVGTQILKSQLIMIEVKALNFCQLYVIWHQQLESHDLKEKFQYQYFHLIFTAYTSSAQNSSNYVCNYCRDPAHVLKTSNSYSHLVH